MKKTGNEKPGDEVVAKRTGIIDTFPLKVPVTGGQLMTLSHYGLMTGDNKAYVEKCFELYQKPEDFKVVLDTIFIGDWSSVDFKEIDIEAFQEGLRNFLSRSVGGSKTSDTQATR